MDAKLFPCRAFDNIENLIPFLCQQSNMIEQISRGWPEPWIAVPWNDKQILITGATNGIGLAAAEALATLGANLAIVGCSKTRTRIASARIRAAAGRARFSLLPGPHTSRPKRQEGLAVYSTLSSSKS